MDATVSEIAAFNSRSKPGKSSKLARWVKSKSIICENNNHKVLIQKSLDEKIILVAKLKSCELY